MNLQPIQTSPINKIIIVGHPLSGYQDMEILLNNCGMKSAQPSRRDRLLPSEISATLCKAHRLPPVGETTHAEIKQIEVGPVWHSMALDLLLGNIDQELWGWSDPQAIYLLDYWKNLDPQLAFVLVYDTPEQYIAQALGSELALDAQVLEQTLSGWREFNSALLHFYHRNPERCLLVHAQQVRASAKTYLQQVRTRIGAPVQPDASETPLNKPHELLVQSAKAADDQVLKTYIAHALLEEQVETMQLYEELQSVANLPLAEQTTGSLPHLAWRSAVALEARYKEQLGLVDEWQRQVERLEKEQSETRQKLQSLQQENELVLARLHRTQEALERHHLEVEQQKEKRKTLQANAAASSSVELQQENELLLLQLHQAQEELERYYLENQRLKLAGANEATAGKAGQYGAAERVKGHLAYRLGEILVQNSKSVPGLICMPWALLNESRRYKRSKLALKGKKLPPLHQYRDAHEGERVKQYLTYKLGATLIAHMRSPFGWVKLPFALRREVKAFKTQRKVA